MISLQSIRKAILDTQPYSELDRLIQNELSTGRKVKEILEEMKPLIDEVLATPGMNEDGEEAFLGTLDALLGNCRKEQSYSDRPTSDVPIPVLPVSPKSTLSVARTV